MNPSPYISLQMIVQVIRKTKILIITLSPFNECFIIKTKQRKKKGKVLQKSAVQVSISSAVVPYIYSLLTKKNQYARNPRKFTKINIQFHINNQ